MERVHPQRSAQTEGQSHYLFTDCDSWNGLVLDRNENLANGEKEDGQDENE